MLDFRRKSFLLSTSTFFLTSILRGPDRDTVGERLWFGVQVLFDFRLHPDRERATLCVLFDTAYWEEGDSIESLKAFISHLVRRAHSGRSGGDPWKERAKITWLIVWIELLTDQRTWIFFFSLAPRVAQGVWLWFILIGQISKISQRRFPGLIYAHGAARCSLFLLLRIEPCFIHFDALRLKVMICCLTLLNVLIYEVSQLCQAHKLEQRLIWCGDLLFIQLFQLCFTFMHTAI